MGHYTTIWLLAVICGTLCLAVPYARNTHDDDSEDDSATEAPRSSSGDSGAEADFLLAVNEDNLDEVNKLIMSGVDVNYNNGIALKYSISRGNLDILNALITAGGDVNANYGEYLTAAAKGGHIDIVKAMIDGGAYSEYFENAKAEASRYGHDDIVQFLTGISESDKGKNKKNNLPV
ncbi:hypothetical protein SK128_024672 [Halocaridina rubra]|uniref:Ankyrin repeat protein n=1 Tax=Halocaridina rubra TaxID=373956 RepID=A0AAN9A8X2_HALRR